MKLGAQFLPEDFPSLSSSRCATAERAGYERAWLVDSQMLWQDVYVYMTHALAATERIVVGTAVTNPLTRHFTVTASAFATLAELHPGRVVLGHRTRRQRGADARPEAGADDRAGRDRSPLLRELMAGRTSTTDGATSASAGHERARADHACPRPGRRTCALAGALADIAHALRRRPPGVRALGDRPRPRRRRGGGTRPGRRRDRRCSAAMWVSDDQEEAWAQCRWAPAACANHIADTMKRNPDHGMPEEMTRLVAGARRTTTTTPATSTRRPSTPSYLTGELIDDFAIAGPAEQVPGQGSSELGGARRRRDLVPRT